MDTKMAATAKWCLVSVAVISAALFLMRSRGWAAGLLLGSSWSVANLLLTVNLLKMSVLKKPAANLTALLLVKFPVLYLAGFLIISSRLFPIESILAGIVTMPIAMGISKLWPSRA